MPEETGGKETYYTKKYVEQLTDPSGATDAYLREVQKRFLEGTATSNDYRYKDEIVKRGIGNGEIGTKGLSVIGPRATYREFAKKIGASFLDVTDEEWSYRKNVAFLQEIVRRGDDVIFAGTYNPKLLDPNSVLAQEIRWLQKHGYNWNKQMTRLIRK